MTASEIGAAVLAAHGVEDATKENVQDIGLAILRSLQNHKGKGVQRVGEASPARWALASNQA